MPAKSKDGFAAHLALFVYCLLLISPSIFFYITKGIWTYFIPVFVVFQMSLLYLIIVTLRYRLFYLTLTLPLLILSCVQWGHFYLFSTELSSGAIAAILATDRAELVEFFMLLPMSFYLVLLPSLILVGALVTQLPRYVNLGLKLPISLVAVLFVVFSVKAYALKSPGRAVEQTFLISHPFKTLFAIGDGVSLFDDYHRQLSNYDANGLALEVLTNWNEPETHVLILGESVRRDHWSLYGYFRDTNPMLSKWRNSGFLFQDVISSANTTIPSLFHSLTVDKQNRRVSLMQAVNSFGFESWWISNQPQFGVFDNPTSVLASTADHQIFVRSREGYDEIMLPEIQKALRSGAQKKLIVVHLMGSHGYYHRRYPSSFSFFKDCSGLKLNDAFPSQCRLTNEYDNSLRYSDYLVASILKSVSEYGNLASLTYVADHGEHLFDVDNMAGHGRQKMTPYEFQVPLFIWLSPRLMHKRPQLYQALFASQSKKISTYDFMPSYLWLLGFNLQAEKALNFFTQPQREHRFIFSPDNQRVSYEAIQ